MEHKRYIRKEIDGPDDRVRLSPPDNYKPTCELLRIRHNKFHGTELCQKWIPDLPGWDFPIWVKIQYCSGDPE